MGNLRPFRRSVARAAGALHHAPATAAAKPTTYPKYQKSRPIPQARKDGLLRRLWKAANRPLGRRRA